MAIKKGVNHSKNKERCSAGNLDARLWKYCKSRYTDLSCSDVHWKFWRMCNALPLGSNVCTNWYRLAFSPIWAQMFKNAYSLYSAFRTQPAFYSQSAVCILHSFCSLPLIRSLQSAVCVLHWPNGKSYSHGFSSFGKSTSCSFTLLNKSSAPPLNQRENCHEKFSAFGNILL